MAAKNDTEIVDWIEDHLDSIYTIGKDSKTVTIIEWTDNQDDAQKTEGASLRDAINKALV